MRVRCSWLVRIAMVVALAVPAVVATAGGAQAAAPDCTKTLVVGVRGSGETQSDYGGFGQTVITAIAGFETRYGTDVTPIPVDYPAASLSVIFQPNGIAQYLGSVNQGVAALLNTLLGAAAACPNQPVVLFGYSQGAMVVHEALVFAQAVWPSLAGRVMGVGLIADPLRLGGRPYEIGTADPALPGLAIVTHAGPNADLPAVVQPRTRSACNAGDPVCAFDLSNLHPEVHTAYAGNGVAYVTGLLVGSAAVGLRWTSPATMSVGTPAHFSSVDPCPPGTAGVTVEILLYAGGGQISDQVPVAGDGSWSADVAWTGSIPASPTYATAVCNSPVPNAPPLALYARHPVTITIPV
jgi:hypothetical protein